VQHFTASDCLQLLAYAIDDFTDPWTVGLDFASCRDGPFRTLLFLRWRFGAP
jgi:hypothetical protein